MKTRISRLLTRGLPLAVLMCTAASAQVPVDDDGNVIGGGNVIGPYETADAQALKNAPATGNEGIPLLSAAELEELVGPVALYPDDLLAVVLPASTYPLQVVQAARFLEELEDNPGLKPDPEWDDSIIALINYPEVVELLNEDLDWTWRLGEAVVAQQADVVNAVENFRDRAYAAGNLKSDGYQTVERTEGVIEITPVNEEIIYVPYYEPERVVYYQPRPVYYYYPRPCPVYYYPYPSGYAFSRPYFWGVTTAFTIGWTSNHLRVFHHSYRGHPYFGRHYYDRWWYRRPDIHIYNNVYSRNTVNVTVNRYVDGDYWRPSRATRLRSSDQRITRNTYYRDQRASSSGSTTINRFVNNRRNGGEDRRVLTTRSGRNGQADTPRLSSQEQMRRTIDEVQRERRVDARDPAQRQRQTTTRRQTTEPEPQNRRSSERRAVTRGDNNSRVTQQQIARQLAEQRQVRDRAPRERQATERRSTQRQSPARDTAQQPTSQRQSVQRQTTQRQTVQRQTTQRQTAQRQSAQRQTVQRQTAQRQTAQRQSAQRQTAQRQSAQRQTAQRQAVQRPTTQRQSSQRQTTQRQSTQRQSSQSSGKVRTESSHRSQSDRERRQRR